MRVYWPMDYAEYARLVKEQVNKMNPELSRRVGKLMHMPSIMALPIARRQAFVDAVDRAETFEQLPKQYQALVIKAEQELQTAMAKQK